MLTQTLLQLSTSLKQEAEKTTELPSEWIEKHFYVPDPRDPITGDRLSVGPIRLAEHQRRIINEALARNPDGTLKYSTVVYSAPKKSGKSAITSAVMLYVAYHTPNSFIACVANDGKQANDRLYGPIHTSIRLHKQLNGILKNESPNLGSVVLTNHTKIEAIPCDAAGEAGSQPLMVAYCFDDKTEILTRAGWKSFMEYSIEDEFATVNKDGFIEYQKPTAIHLMRYIGNMYALETRNASVCVSPKHKLHGKFYRHTTQKHAVDFADEYVENLDKYKFYAMRVETHGINSFSDAPEHVIIPATKRKPELKIPIKLYLELLGWYLAEGCTHKNDTILIAQKQTSPYYKEIQFLIRSLGYIPRKWKGTSALVFYETRLAKHLSQLGLAHEKFIPDWVKDLPKEYIDIFLDAYYKGDGSKKARVRGRVYSTNSHQLHDDLMEIAVKHGLYVTSTVHQDKRWGKPVYQVSIKTHKNGKRSIGIPTNRWQLKEYDGIIHCPTVPNGLVITRRNGKICVQHQSELWGYETPKKRKIFTEMTIPPTLHGHAMRWIESYAGYSGVSELLEQVYQTGFIEGKPHPDFLDLQGRDGPVVRINERARMFIYWDTEHRMPWQTEDYYIEEEELLPAQEFRRIHLNQWVSPIDSFIQEEWWEACEDDRLPVLLSKHVPVVVGIDMANTRDCAALVAVTRDPFDPETKVAVRGVKIFSPKQLGGMIDQEKVIRPVIEEWADRWNVVCWVYDPREMAKLAQDMVREGVGWFKVFGQTTPRTVSDKALYDMIVSKHISWSSLATYGDVGYKGLEGENLYRHITLAGANIKGDAYRLEKLSNNNKIDGAVALSQAAYIAMQLALDNDETNLEHIIDRYRRRELTEEEFSKLVRHTHPELQKRLEHGN